MSSAVVLVDHSVEQMAERTAVHLAVYLVAMSVGNLEAKKVDSMVASKAGTMAALWAV